MDSKQIMHIGIDDTDSTRKGCTTYVACLLIEKLEKLNVKFIDYPNLIRLNPNVPWKTRGNGALCIRFEYFLKMEKKIKQITKKIVESYSDLDFENTNPGIVFFIGEEIPKEIQIFSRKTIKEVVYLDNAINLIKKFDLHSIGLKNHRGLIGALAAIGERLDCDHTYELIAYRERINMGKKRAVNEKSVFLMDEKTKPYTFNNVDYEKKRIIITPRGPDPILFGIRGETAQLVKRAFSLVKVSENVGRWVIFRTNQGTDAHIKKIKSLSALESFQSVRVKGIVSKNPKIVPLRHVIFSIRDNSSEIDCAAYEPTGSLRKIARSLIVGDEIEVYGSVRQKNSTIPVTINLEKIKILSIYPTKEKRNPFCPKCKIRLKSLGKNKGFRCDKCRDKYLNIKREEKSVERTIDKGLYITSVRSQRHLTKPYRRYGLEKKCKEKIVLIEKWHD